VTQTVNTPLIVFASGRGSNFDALLKATKTGVLPGQIVGLVCSKPDAEVIQKAKDANIPVLVSRDEEQIHSWIQASPARHLVLAGYMKILSADFINKYRDKNGNSQIVNIHPSLLPNFKGVNAYKQAWEAGVKVTGVTVHLVEPDLDSGPILAQESFIISGCKNLAEVEARGLAVEHVLYPQALKQWMNPDTEGEDHAPQI
jgi:phosphoribosylglycinamide formyltransferase-1